MNFYVNFGCGTYAPKEWLNFDVSPTLKIHRIPVIGKWITNTLHKVDFPEHVRYGDIVKGLPIPLNSCKAIFSSHVLEHLTLEDAKTALHNCYHLLQPNGTLRLLLPDLEKYILQYQEQRLTNTGAAHQFMQNTILGVDSKPKDWVGKLAFLFGNYRHLWMWDFHSLKAELEKLGFNNIKRCKIGDSTDPMFALVEDPTRFVDELYIEAIK